MNWAFGGPKPLLALGALATASVLSVGGYFVASSGSGGSPTKVLGEKITGSGSGTSTAGGAGATTNSKPTSGGNGGGPSTPPASKSFTIALGSQHGDFGPGTTSELFLDVTNTSNQNIHVDSLSASLLSITKDSDNTAPGNCTLSNSGFQIVGWSGDQFDVLQGETASSAPGYIEVSMSAAAPDACQGATFNLSFSGTAVKA